MNKKLLAIASLCAFSLAACQTTGSVQTDLAETYRLHTPDGVIVTSDPAIIAEYRAHPEATIVALSDDRIENAMISADASEPAAP